MGRSQKHFEHVRPHMAAKHAILGKYLRAWFSILGPSRENLVYIDGFSGPGRFKDGNDGSPLVALRASSALKSPRTRMHFYFIDKKRTYARQLHALLSDKDADYVPANASANAIHGVFADEFLKLLDVLDSPPLANNAQVLAFIDPFGVKGVPFDHIIRLLRRGSAEVLITFMNEGVRRCATDHPELLASLYGSDSAAARITASEDKVGTAREAYMSAFEERGFRVCSFPILTERDRPLYDLIFVSKHVKGIRVMKDAMWASGVGATLGFSYDEIRRQASPQTSLLFEFDPALGFVAELASHFRGHNIGIEDLEDYCDGSRTWLRKHASEAVQAMEQPGGCQGHRVRVTRALNKIGRKVPSNQFPTGTRIEFLS